MEKKTIKIEQEVKKKGQTHKKKDKTRKLNRNPSKHRTKPQTQHLFSYLLFLRKQDFSYIVKRISQTQRNPRSIIRR